MTWRRWLIVGVAGLLGVAVAAVVVSGLWRPAPEVLQIERDRSNPHGDHLRQLAPRTPRRGCRLDMEASGALLALDRAKDISEAEPALGRLLDAAGCDRIGTSTTPVPTASVQRWFDAAIDELRSGGDRAGAARWATDGLALAPDLATIGRVETAVAAIDLELDLSKKAAEDIAYVTPTEASRTAEVASWAGSRQEPLSSAIDVEMSAESHRRWPTPADLAAHVPEASALESERRLWMAFVNSSDPPPREARILDGPALVAAREVVPRIRQRYRALVLLGAAVASRPDSQHCLADIDAMRESVPKDVLPADFPMTDLAWEAGDCTVSLLDRDRTVLERYSAIVKEP
jgi:hypothetical protein